MKWQYQVGIYLQTYCTARGLSIKTIKAYGDTLHGFKQFVKFRLDDKSPEEISTMDILSYLECLRNERGNGHSSVNRTAVVIKGFYKAMVAMGHMLPSENPAVMLPKMKQAPRKLPSVLSEDQVYLLLDQPSKETVLGLRDRAILCLLYGTGIRASEVATLKACDVDFENKTITVLGKGGHTRRIPFNIQVKKVMRQYVTVRGLPSIGGCFFKSRTGGAISRGTVHDRVTRHARKARIGMHVSPHMLRHTFATHLLRKGEQLKTISTLLGHRQLSSTEIYLHITVHELRSAVEVHPLIHLIRPIENLLPGIKMPIQNPPGTKFRFG